MNEVQPLEMQLCQIPFDEARAAENMAIDSTMLEFGQQTGQALWRLYGWTEPSITFGYSQSWDWVQGRMAGFEGSCVRRITGGGIVDHRNDLTYSLSIPPEHACFRIAASKLYQELHGCVASAILDLGHRAALAECRNDCAGKDPSRVRGLCFEGPEPFDVVNPLTGAKLAGAAMRRSRSGVLIQGSVDLRVLPGISRSSFAASFGNNLSAWLGLEPAGFSGSLPARILVREWERFSSRDWNRRR